MKTENNNQLDKASRIEEILKLKYNLFRLELKLPLSFDDLLFSISRNPDKIFRNIFQLFSDMINHYVTENNSGNFGENKLASFTDYNTNSLFILGCNSPFFADRLFASRFVSMANSLKKGLQTNRIYL